MKYRKTSTSQYGKVLHEFEAMKYTGDNSDECILFGAGISPAVWMKPGSGLIIKGVNGEFIIEQNDWIIKLAENNYHRCRGNLFHILYEPALTEEKSEL